MSHNSSCTVYIGNLDERVTERVLYDILIQAGRVVDLHIPKDKDSEKPKGFAFAVYETEEIADYAVRLFSGLVTLYKRTLKFAISGKDKTTPNASTATTPTSNSSQRPRPYPAPLINPVNLQHSSHLLIPDRFSDYGVNYSQVPPHCDQSSGGYGSHYRDNDNEYIRRAFGAALDSISHPRSGIPDRFSLTSYPSY